jgi:hypothetical protein
MTAGTDESSRNKTASAALLPIAFSVGLRPSQAKLSCNRSVGRTAARSAGLVAGLFPGAAAAVKPLFQTAASSLAEKGSRGLHRNQRTERGLRNSDYFK